MWKLLEDEAIKNGANPSDFLTYIANFMLTIEKNKIDLSKIDLKKLSNLSPELLVIEETSGDILANNPNLRATVEELFGEELPDLAMVLKNNTTNAIDAASKYE
ncbi:hypothetical protein MBAV_002815, partial [Candidatus Magnetobacterium bavaricum]